MYILSVNMWFQTLMRQFFFNVDKIVFNFIPTIYDLLISIARTSILSQADIINMADRIYKLLAVFMVFKVTFSLIMYAVNPDDFSDKSKGIGKLVTNIIISLSLLILTPYIFRGAYKLQTIILEDNSLFTVIFGDDKNNNDDENNLEAKNKGNNALLTAGDSMAFTAIIPFFSPNIGKNDLTPCATLIDEGEFNPNCSDVLDGFVNEGTLSRVSKENYIAGVENRSLGLMFRQDIATATDESKQLFIIDYKYIFSTVVGVIIVLLLISFCLDIALRGIKLAFLQLVAPIPIISYIDPKSGKDGMFKKWYQMCFKTFLSLFVRLLAIYFAVYIISRIDKMSDIIDGSYISNLYIKIFVIIGALMFAKQFPKILEGLGIKLDDGKFVLNPLRKIENEALGGNILKKPNDMLAKFGKGVALAPLNGASLLAKKTVAGAYSAANGRGFSRGFKSVDSNFKRAINKKIDEWAPDFAKDRADARVAKLDAEEAERRKRKVEKYFKGTTQAERDKKKEDFKKDLEGIDSQYARLYKEAETRKGDMYTIQSWADSWKTRISNETMTSDERKKLSEYFDGEGASPLSDDQLIKKLNKEAGAAEKTYNKANEAKETYGKTSASARRAAQFEAAYDTYDKLNPLTHGNRPVLGTDFSPSPQNTPQSSSESIPKINFDDLPEADSSNPYAPDTEKQIEIIKVSLKKAIEVNAGNQDKQKQIAELKKQLEDLIHMLNEAKDSEKRHDLEKKINEKIRELDNL